MANEMTALVDISRCPTLRALTGPKPLLALPPPSLRIDPSEVPATFRDFEAWSTWACFEWPAPLQVEAYYAMEGLQFKKADAHDTICKFLNSYKKWLARPEREKFSRDHKPHPYRLTYLERARDVVRQNRRRSRHCLCFDEDARRSRTVPGVLQISD